MTHRVAPIVTVLSLLFAATAPAHAAPPSPEKSYLEARKAYHALRDDPVRRKYRHHWLSIATRFEQVARAAPKSPRAPEALYNAAQLYTDLSRYSGQSADLKPAITNYQRLIDGYPKHRLADDASLELARIHADRLEQLDAARGVLERGLKLSPQGDQAPVMRSLLAQLPKAKPAPKLAAKPPAPMKPAPKAPEPKEVVAQAPSGEGSALWSAFARVAALGDGGDKPPPIRPRPRRLAPDQLSAGPLGDEAPLAQDDDTGDGEGLLPSIAEVQERLRDVRVGAPHEVDTAEAKARLKRVERQERISEVTLAEQLGLKVRRVVIDAGHGGHDTGAIGRSGTREKDIALAISKQLARQLTHAGFEVVMTRDDDRYLKLEDRAQLANRAKGDLFISIHCNSAPNRSSRGIETYTLNTSADRYSIRLAARENASTERGVSDLQFILADLATKANTDESTRLARRVQSSLVSQLRVRYPGVKDLGHKEALFFVLLGVRMPAILVETSFLSHPEEERLLRSPQYQADVARAIAQGISEFVGNRERLAHVE